MDDRHAMGGPREGRKKHGSRRGTGAPRARHIHNEVDQVLDMIGGGPAARVPPEVLQVVDSAVRSRPEGIDAETKELLDILDEEFKQGKLTRAEFELIQEQHLAGVVQDDGNDPDKQTVTRGGAAAGGGWGRARLAVKRSKETEEMLAVLQQEFEKGRLTRAEYELIHDQHVAAEDQSRQMDERAAEAAVAKQSGEAAKAAAGGARKAEPPPDEEDGVVPLIRAALEEVPTHSTALARSLARSLSRSLPSLSVSPSPRPRARNCARLRPD